MAPQATHPRFISAPRRRGEDRPDDGAWWPENRSLQDQLKFLFASWPATQQRISRVSYSPPDWDDRPRMVAVGDNRLVKTGSFPRDDTHLIVLTLSDGSRQSIRVIAPETPPDVAAEILEGLTPDAP
jgi:hypothetical protein